MPKQYMVNRKEMIRQMREQYVGEPLEGPLRLEVDLYGEGRGDADNILGSLMDAGNGVLWKDDRVSIISEIEVSWHRAKKVDSKWLVRLRPLE
jgi:Holliday junction resolvase RusA-like endonuclease